MKKTCFFRAYCPQIHVDLADNREGRCALHGAQNTVQKIDVGFTSGRSTHPAGGQCHAVPRLGGQFQKCSKFRSNTIMGGILTLLWCSAAYY